MEYLFWSLILLSVYGYVGYPVLLWGLAFLFGEKQNDTAYEQSKLPTVSILVAAYNEEENIKDKVSSLLAQKYPSDLLDIWILDDGSTDKTGELASSFDEERVHILRLPRKGKATALIKGVEASSGTILVFSDADTIWQESTLKEMIAPFANDRHGAVAGKLVTRKKVKHLGFGDKIYHRYESFIRLKETELKSAVSADGGLFAIKRSIWQGLPQDVTDDFYISTAAVCNDKAIVFQESALAFDTGVEKAKSQLKKRVRITVRGLTSLYRRRQLFNPFRYGLYSIFLISHKLIRRLVPCFALLLFPLSFFLLNNNLFYTLFFVAQSLFYFSAFIGLIDKGKNLPKVFSLIGFIFLNSYGVFLGVVHFIKGKRFTYWSPEQNR